MLSHGSATIPPAPYELLDFGDGKKLERFGERILERAAPPAEGLEPRHASLWRTADFRYRRTDGDQGVWTPHTPAPWHVQFPSLTVELKANDFGHVGLFPEQAENWDWIAHQVRTAGRPLQVLNLFAYTGAATLAAAAAGAQVTHVDAARNVVTWARTNAELSGLNQAPVRWIVEDAAKFVGRELRRGRHYDAVILDPPTYGHGPQGEPWVLKDRLPELLERCLQLTRAQRAFFLLTCHSPGWGPAELRELVLAQDDPLPPARLATRRLALHTARRTPVA